MQALFQLDCSGDANLESIRGSLDRGESPGGSREFDAGFQLAQRVWERREDADKAIGALSLEWPVHRLARVDRSLLRLGWFELTVDTVSKGVCINDLVEIAKTYSGAKSASFVNALLDEVAPAGEGSVAE